MAYVRRTYDGGPESHNSRIAGDGNYHDVDLSTRGRSAQTYQPKPYRPIVGIEQHLGLHPDSGWSHFGVGFNSASGAAKSTDTTLDAHKAQGESQINTSNHNTKSGSFSHPAATSSDNHPTSRAQDHNALPVIVVNDTSPKSKLSAFAPVFDPTNMNANSLEILQLGGLTCKSCAQNPSHYFMPCEHKICSTCIQPWGSDLKAKLICGFCKVNVYGVKNFPPPEYLSTDPYMDAQNRLRRVPQLSGGFQQAGPTLTLPQGGPFGRIVGATNNIVSQEYSNDLNNPDMRTGGPSFPSQISHGIPTRGSGFLIHSPTSNYLDVHRSVSQNSGFVLSPHQSSNQMNSSTAFLPQLGRGIPTNAAQQDWQQGPIYGAGPFDNSTESQGSNMSFATQVPLPYHMPAGQTPTTSFASPIIPPQGEMPAVPNPLAGPEFQSFPPPNPLQQENMYPYGGLPAWNNSDQQQSPYIQNPLNGWGDNNLMQGQMSQNVQGYQNEYAQHATQSRPDSSNGLRYRGLSVNGGYGSQAIHHANGDHNDNGGYGTKGSHNANSYNISRFNADNLGKDSTNQEYNHMVQNQLYHKKLQDTAPRASDAGSGRQSVESYMSNSTQYQQQSASNSRRQSVDSRSGGYISGSDYRSEINGKQAYNSGHNATEHQAQDEDGDNTATVRKIRHIQRYNAKAQPASATKIPGELGHIRTPLKTPNAGVPQTAPHRYVQKNQPQGTPTQPLRRRGDSVGSLRNGSSVIKNRAPPAFHLPTVVDSPTLSPSQSNTAPPGILARLNENEYFSVASQKANPDPFVVAALSNSQVVPFGDDIPGVSRQLRILSMNGPPTVETAFNNLPFCETGRQVGPATYGVVRITNIPYSVTRAEVLAFLGRNAKIVNENESEPIHILMERVTSKTMDCYIEFINEEEANNAVNRYEVNRNGGRGGRLGQRHVELEVVSQATFMKELFPKARNVRWIGARPEIYPVEECDMKWNSGFKGFCTNEEMVMLLKHVETPQRSPFSKDCPQRPFECLITTLYKLPWYMVDCITLKQRTRMYKTTVELITLLHGHVEANDKPLTLNTPLLKRVLIAALKCAGFTQSQKAEFRLQAGKDEFEYELAPYAQHWPFQTIGPKKGSEFDTIMYFQALLRESQDQAWNRLSLAEQQAIDPQEDGLNVFGPINFGFPDNVQDLTMGDIAKIEWNIIERILRDILPTS